MISGFLKTKSKEKHTKLTVVNWYSTPIDTFNEIQTLHSKIRKIANSNIVIENVEMFSIYQKHTSIHIQNIIYNNVTFVLCNKISPNLLRPNVVVI